MALLYLLFSKFVPMISIWELKAGLPLHEPLIAVEVPAGTTELSARESPFPGGVSS
jgi:hypothetical protein